MPAARARHIPALLDIHAEDLAFLWSQRREALGSRKHTLREYAELNERIEAHVQGLLIAPPDALVAMMQPRLAAPDRDEVFAAAYALLHLNERESTHLVVIEFSRATGATLAGLRDAFSVAPHALFAAEMQSALDKSKPTTAISAAVVLANQRLLDAQSPRLTALLEDADDAVCELAWRTAALVDAARRLPEPNRRFNHCLAHAAPAVRSAGWATAAWSAQAPALPLLRHFVGKGDAVALHWLAVLGNAEDCALLHQSALALDDAATHCELLARYGHPSSIDLLLPMMEGADLALAAAAGQAFTRITGVDIQGRRTTLPVSDDADDFEREMAPDIWLPDVVKARAAVERHGARWAEGSRWCCGHRIDIEIGRDLLAQLDLEARWDCAARAAMAGRPVSAPRPIH